MRMMTLLTLLGAFVAVPATSWAHDRGRGGPRQVRTEYRHHGHHARGHHHVPVIAVAPPVTRVWVPAHWVGFGRHRMFLAGAWTVTPVAVVAQPPPRQPQWVWDHATQRWVWQ